MAEKLPCQIAQDLMPLALDNVCSEESRKAVEQHAAECAPCRQIYAQMKGASPAPLPAEQTAKAFRRALKRQGRKMRWWKITAVICALALALTGTFFAVHPEPLLAIPATAPVAWFQNACLVRTNQNVVLLQFTPDARYRHYFGNAGSSWEGETIINGEWAGDRRIAFRYPWLARTLNTDFAHPDYERAYKQEERECIRLSNGDWVVAPCFEMNWFFLDGEIRHMSYRALTSAEIRAYVEKGIEITADTQIFAREDDAEIDRRVILCDANGHQKVIYTYGDDIPLCDAETQQKFDQLIEKFPNIYSEEGALLQNSYAGKGKED